MSDKLHVLHIDSTHRETCTMVSSHIVGYNLCRVLFTVALLASPVLFSNSVLWIVSIVILYKIVKLVKDHWVKYEFDVHNRGVFITGCDSGPYIV